MSDIPVTCEPRWVELFLNQQLSEAEQAAFERHLDACEGCRKALEERAARAESWLSARESLTTDDLDAGTHESPARSATSDAAPADELAMDRLEVMLGRLAPTDDPRMLGRLGAYEIVGVIGYGGMGVVLKGYEASLNRYVAIKVLASHLASSGSARQRFEREAQAAAAVVHENVVAIHTVAEWNGLPYLVMPYVRGASLQKRLDQQGPLGVTEVLRVARQVAAGLSAAHAQGLVHRDIKPANILLEDGIERLKITDFGLARAADDASLTRSGVIAGTPQYMSPEQARGEALDARSDLFSLGSVMYAMCTGRPPFRAETSYGILRRITDSEPRPIQEVQPDVPEWLTRTISRLLAKSPDDRFSSASELATLMERCLAHVQHPTAVPLPDEVRPRRVAVSSRRRWWIAGLGLAGCALLAAIATWGPFRPTLGTRGEHPPPAEAQTAPRPEEASDSVDPATDWNDVARQIDLLMHDANEFDTRAQRLWDRQPATRSSESDNDEPTSAESEIPE